MRVAVTGGAGFIGANLVHRLVDTGSEIVVVDDLSTGYRKNLSGLDLRFIEGTILDAGTLDTAFAGVDAVVHLAAVPSVPRSLVDPVHSHEVNAGGTLAVLEAVRRAGEPHLLVASSSSVYGADPVLPKGEDLAGRPMSPYAASKLASEGYSMAYAACFGLDVLTFRFFNVFGPLQAAGHAYAAVVPVFIDAALQRKPLPVYGDGQQTRDFTFVGTVSAVLADALRRRVTSATPVNLAFGTRTSVLELVHELADVVGYPLRVEDLPPRAGDVRDSQADNTRLQKLFADIVPVDLRAGLEATVAWFESEASAANR